MERQVAGRLAGKVAVITGGASGIGRATALTFLGHGARVVIGDLNRANLGTTVALAREAGHGDAIAAIRADVSCEPDVAALVDLAVHRFGALDCVFNNAGVGGAFGPIGQTTVEEWDFTFAVLVRGVFLGIKHGANRLQSQGRGGSIINTASVAGLAGGAGPHAYSAAKAAVVNLTRAVSAELAHARIRVNAICPGFIDTPLATGPDHAKYERFVHDRQPWLDLGQPQDIANAALFLASDESSFMTGQIMTLDGGITAWPNAFGHDPQSRMLRKAGFNAGSTGDPGTLRDVPR